ncbi:hypothetical protein EW145_g2152 [Phellinidium pouzarii]|uniref:AAA-ATPase-like domain-containing protein n=1 Tax=Phellinidium pouzarii TaxID=167371 RepID=A0A4S4LDU2_9AGAM|nr:hypothetical protein EW145_g2152 [Phellinidium pouzarii]
MPITRASVKKTRSQATEASRHISIKDDLATSVWDFETRLTSCDCVDKTSVILAFLKTLYPIHLVLRPRRCGKTTLLTMFRHEPLRTCRAFFEIGTEEDVQKRRSMFSTTPTSVSMSPIFETYFAQHPVIWIDFFAVRGTNLEDMRISFDRIVREEFIRQRRLGHFDHLNDEFREEVRKAVDGTELNGAHAFTALAEVLYIATKKKVILLIDEYDTPIVDSAEGGYRKDSMKGLNSIHGTVMAGILRIQQTGFLSGFNNLTTYTLNSALEMEEENPYSKALLFTSEEVEALYNHYNEKEKFPFTLRKLKQWYGGYYAARDIELFNPWSVCCALERRSLKGYWTASGVDNLLLRHVMNSGVFQDALDALIDGKDVEALIGNPKVGIEDDMDLEDILDLMVYSGYLRREGRFVKIPNLELRVTFFAWSEQDGGHGRMDILIEEIGGRKAVILELKISHADSKKGRIVQTLKSLANKAIQQIEERKYRARFDDPIVELREYGIALSGKKCEIRVNIMHREYGDVWKVRKTVMA